VQPRMGRGRVAEARVGVLVDEVIDRELRIFLRGSSARSER
jgi:hypothetical protein